MGYIPLGVRGCRRAASASRRRQASEHSRAAARQGAGGAAQAAATGERGPAASGQEQRDPASEESRKKPDRASREGASLPFIVREACEPEPVGLGASVPGGRAPEEGRGIFPEPPNEGALSPRTRKAPLRVLELFKVARLWDCALCGLCAAPSGVCPYWLLRADKSRPDGL